MQLGSCSSAASRPPTCSSCLNAACSGWSWYPALRHWAMVEPWNTTWGRGEGRGGEEVGNRGYCNITQKQGPALGPTPCWRTRPPLLASPVRLASTATTHTHHVEVGVQQEDAVGRNGRHIQQHRLRGACGHMVGMSRGVKLGSESYTPP